MEDEPKQVVITDVKMPFFSMVIFITKWMLASIPAFIIIGLIFGGIGLGLKMSGLLPTFPNMQTDSRGNSMPSFPNMPSPDEFDSE
jgi:hypothetical protein